MIKKDIAIIGGGIGGLAVANALLQIGIKPLVYEATDLKVVGSGITLPHNAIVYLEKLGLKNTLLKVANEISKFSILTTGGRNLLSLKTESDQKQKNYAIHRKYLHEILLSHLPNGVVFTNKPCTKIVDNKETATLHFKDGSCLEVEGIIIADGINSQLRSFVNPRLTTIRSGIVCWRGILELGISNSQQRYSSEIWGKNKVFGIVPLGKNSLYWFATTHDQETILSAEKENFYRSWNKDYLIDFYKEFPPNVQNIISQTLIQNILFDHLKYVKPDRFFAKNRAALLGDAAHGMLPFSGQGAAQALRDSLVLTDCIKCEKEWAAALNLYSKRRTKQIKKLQNITTVIARLTTLKNPLLINFRDIAMAFTPNILSNTLLNYILKAEISSK